MKYEADSNCSIVCANKNPHGLTLRDVADRLQISFPRVKQIQDKAMEKAAKRGLFDFMEE
jgi:DNA-directed RNA polymerase sigma subunit (sigma70/sigma32)|tara:strand:+ start:153 stop:332 length:180 start_codon:yes stop_codon:yes gene_type:complete